MACTFYRGAIICEPDAYGEADVLGKTWRWDFTDSAGGGPLFLRKNGEPLANQNPPRIVWDAFQRWLDAYYIALAIRRIAVAITRAAQAHEDVRTRWRRARAERTPRGKK